MRKKILLLSAAVFCAVLLHAQANDENFIIQLSPGIGVPTGKFATTNKLGFTGRLNLDFVLAEKLRLEVSSGSAGYSGKSYNSGYGYTSNYPDYTFIPVYAGLKYFYFRGLFVTAQGGAVFTLTPEEHPSGFGYAAAAGFEFGGPIFYDVALRYDGYAIKGASLGTISLAVSYEF